MRKSHLFLIQTLRFLHMQLSATPAVLPLALTLRRVTTHAHIQSHRSFKGKHGAFRCFWSLHCTSVTTSAVARRVMWSGGAYVVVTVVVVVTRGWRWWRRRLLLVGECFTFALVTPETFIGDIHLNAMRGKSL